MVVEGELGKREVVDPVVLLIGHIGMEIAFERLVGVLREAVSLRVVHCGVTELDL